MLVELFYPLPHIFYLIVGDLLHFRVGLPVLPVVVGAVNSTRDDADRVLGGALERTARAVDGAHGDVAPGVALAVGVHEARGVLREPAAGVAVDVCLGLALLDAVAALREPGLALRLPVFDVDESGYEGRLALWCTGLPVLEPTVKPWLETNARRRGHVERMGDVRVVAQHPVPLSVTPVARAEILEDDVG